jgi:alkyldihydroxyacetonephosphate synthase
LLIGHTCQEVYALRFGEFARIPDLVVWPGSHEHVEVIVRAAVEHNAVIIPFGGGTSVTQALVCPDEEKRFIVSLDMHAMCNIKWYCSPLYHAIARSMVHAIGS